MGAPPGRYEVRRATSGQPRKKQRFQATKRAAATTSRKARRERPREGRSMTRRERARVLPPPVAPWPRSRPPSAPPPERVGGQAQGHEDDGDSRLHALR